MKQYAARDDDGARPFQQPVADWLNVMGKDARSVSGRGAPEDRAVGLHRRGQMVIKQDLLASRAGRPRFKHGAEEWIIGLHYKRRDRGSLAKDCEERARLRAVFWHDIKLENSLRPFPRPAEGNRALAHGFLANFELICLGPALAGMK